MRSASLLILSALSLVLQIYAAPAPGTRDIIQKRDAGDSCLSKDPRCKCVGGAIFCGYVDSDWHTPAKPIETTTNVPVRKPKVATATSPEVVIVKDPLKTALLELNAYDDLDSVQLKIIRNQFSLETNGQFAVGLSGFRNYPFKIRGKQFDAAPPSDSAREKTAYWTVYWDFSWYGPGGTPPESGIFGPHVVLFVQFNGQVSHTLYYPPADDLFATAAQQGDYYFDRVLDPLRNLARLNTTMNLSFDDLHQLSHDIGAQWRTNLPAPPPPPAQKPRPLNPVAGIPQNECVEPPSWAKDHPSPSWCVPGDKRRVFQGTKWGDPIAAP